MSRAPAGALLLALATACVAPVSLPPTPAPLPSLPFATDTARSFRVARGVSRWFAYAPSGPWAVHALVVDRDACWSARAVKGFPDAVGREKTSTLLARLDDTVETIGGVNADFFTFDPPGVPTNLHVSGGRAITGPNGRPVLWFDARGTPRISAPRTALKSGPATPAAAVFDSATSTPIWEAVGGRPLLLRDSAIVAGVDSGGTFATTRHPRTAVGIARDGKRLILVVVDGRQAPYSDGMTLREMAELMRGLGARDAINLDGGGSSAFVVADSAGTPRVANRPSDPTGERAVGNALAIVRGC